MQVFAESSPIELAIEDLIRDLSDTLGLIVKASVNPPSPTNAKIVVGCLEDEAYKAVAQSAGLNLSEWSERREGFSIQVSGETLYLSGSNTRGTLYAIYAFSERYLGIDPFYFWSDLRPQALEELRIEQSVFSDWPKSFPIRGWFINDEDLLSTWSGGEQRQHPRYPMKIMSLDVFDKVLETALRCRQNLVIPATYHDIDRPENEALFRRIGERGLIASQHHQEPLGVSADILEAFWKKKGLDIPANYLDHKEKYEAAWRHHIRKYLASGTEMVWQLGLRGKGDRPFWYGSPTAPQTVEERGKVISDAIRHQWETIRDELGHERFASTITLWMEGSELNKLGVLKFPPQTTVIFSDFGPTQNMREDFRDTPRQAGMTYGAYYHVAFMSCGPHLAQGTSPERISRNFAEMNRKGDTAYCILNVSNIREFLFGIDMVRKLCWDAANNRPEDHYDEWSKARFAKLAEKVSQSYRDLYDGYHQLGNPSPAPDQEDMILLDGMVLKAGKKLLQVLDGQKFEPDPLQNQRIYNFDTPERMARYYRNATSESLEKWTVARERALETLADLPDHEKRFFESAILVQLDILIGLCHWLRSICTAVADEQEIRLHLNRAHSIIEDTIQSRERAAYGKWEGWYSNEKLYNLEEASKLTRSVRDSR